MQVRFTGRIIADGVLKEVGEHKVINFTVVINDYVRKKGAEEVTQVPTYINVAYWNQPNAVDRLRRGSIVEVSGRLKAEVYMTNSDAPEPKAALVCNAYHIKTHFRSKPDHVDLVPETEAAEEAVGEGLPF